MADAHSDEEHVVVRRFDDPVEAEITLNFLRDHGVTVALRGNSGSTAVLNRFSTVMDIRLVVPRDELDRALETLAALHTPSVDATDGGPPTGAEDDAPTAGAGPYRATKIAPPEGELAARHRYRSGPMVLAWVVPGGGHFYARHNRMGLLFAAGIVSFVVAGAMGGRPWMVFAAMLMAACDALLGVVAVGRFNRGAVLGAGAQTGLAAVAMAASAGAALALTAAGLGAPRRHYASPEPPPPEARPWE